MNEIERGRFFTAIQPVIEAGTVRAAAEFYQPQACAVGLKNEILAFAVGPLAADLRTGRRKLTA